MKKLMLTAAIVCAAVMTQAASVKWKCTAESADVGTTVYLLTTVSTSYKSLTEFTGSAISSGEIVEISSGRGKKYETTEIFAENANLLKTAPYYLAIVDGDTIHILDVAAGAGKVYDPAAQEASPGAFTTTLSDIRSSSHTATIGAVPEPTSGLMLLFGIAGLALRRKQRG